jgi:hypothetical protein
MTYTFNYCIDIIEGTVDDVSKLLGLYNNLAASIIVGWNHENNKTTIKCFIHLSSKKRLKTFQGEIIKLNLPLSLEISDLQGRSIQNVVDDCKLHGVDMIESDNDQISSRGWKQLGCFNVQGRKLTTSKVMAT